MGNSSCSACSCVDSAQLELRRSIAHDIITANIERKSAFAQNLVQAAVSSPGASPSPSPEDLGRIYAQFEDKLERIQAVWRGRQERKQFAVMRKQSSRHSFFTPEEVRETLRRGQSPPNVLSNSRRQYQSGAVYTGSWRGGFRHGEGVMEYPCGAKYSGKWSWGYPFGIGTFHHSDSEEFIGEWKNPNVTGRVSFMLSGKKALDRWKNGLRDGYEWLWYKEELKLRTGRSLLGAANASPKTRLEEIRTRLQHLHDMIEQTKLLSANNSMSQLSKSGLRKYVETTLENNVTYKGEMLGPKRDGFGENTWRNGDTYVGEWKNDEQYGWGTNHWADGSEYIGTYISNRKDGVGEYKWEDGSVYVGEWKDNQMHGIGEYKWVDGRCYMGEWESGLMSGFGRFQWANKKVFEGNWLKGKKHGEGVIINPDGSRSADIWNMGKVQAHKK